MEVVMACLMATSLNLHGRNAEKHKKSVIIASLWAEI
jgi:hypothetical protein